jgi:TusA-related sulfurtransferase
MTTINANTKIAAIIKQHPDALETIISINPKFEKLRNPILRKIMAGRTSIAMASKISGCSVNTFFEKLKPLGFKIDTLTMPVEERKKEVPDFITSLKKEQLVELDVRPVIASGKDPLSLITEKVKTIKPGQVLKITNSFEPVPLMRLLEKQGFVVYADVLSDILVETYFFKQDIAATTIMEPGNNTAEGWEETLQKFADNLQTIDVRSLEMPLPMLTILKKLENLPKDTALFVYHKRIPVFLLPELTEKKFDYRIKEISDGEVRLLIFKA